jgi:predicted nucleic acid-binding protein
LSAYFDTSALVKLILNEPESATVARVWNATADAYASTIGYVELRAAVARAGRDGRIGRSSIATTRADLDDVWRQVVTVDADAAVMAGAGALAERHALAALDAIHLASARDLADRGRPFLFVTFDRRLAEAALAEGLAVLPEVA